MVGDYTQLELNKILLSKSLDDFYVATIENRPAPLTDEEMGRIRKGEVSLTGGTGLGKALFEKLVSSKSKKVDDLLKRTIGNSGVRQCAILTMIDGQIYDIANNVFIDLERRMIIHYDNLTTIYNDSNARLKVFTKEDVSFLTEDRVALDVDNDVEYLFTLYEEEHFKQTESKDLTHEFIKKARPNTFKLN